MKKYLGICINGTTKIVYTWFESEEEAWDWCNKTKINEDGKEAEFVDVRCANNRKEVDELLAWSGSVE